MTRDDARRLIVEKRWDGFDPDPNVWNAWIYAVVIHERGYLVTPLVESWPRRKKA